MRLLKRLWWALRRRVLDLDGIQLDLGCGSTKGANWVGMDVRSVPGVDIVHRVEDVPWPLPSNCCHRILMSHLWEHIEPKHRLAVMDEAWRVMKDGGQLMIAAPYATSFGAAQDPTHYPCPNEATFQYFDPEKNAVLYGIYRPKPWKLERNAWRQNGSMEVILEARKGTRPKRVHSEREERRPEEPAADCDGDAGNRSD